MGLSDQRSAYDKFTSIGSNNYAAGTNGISGFQQWECYMLLKYGKAGNFGLSGRDEYLIELPMYPEEVTEQISATWTTQSVLGRSSPLSAYAQTELKSASFSLDLHRDFLTGSFSHSADTMNSIPYMQPQYQSAGNQKQSEAGPFRTRSWYININKMLQMSCYPQYTNAGIIPPTTYFIFGQMILKGYVTSYQTSWKKPIINTFYGWNTVQINMECYPDTIISAHDMIDGKGAMSTQNTYNTTFPASKATNSDVMNASRFNRTNARTAGSVGGQVINT